MKYGYCKAKELAQKWNVTPRRINQLCAAGLLPGSYKDGKFWMIPTDIARPSVLRDKAATGYTIHSGRTTRLLPCPVGITSYKEVARECYYVDKTLLIRDILDEHSKVYLFTRPRRFGKTLAMDMIRTFFEETDEDTSLYFQDKKIWTCDPVYRSFQGRYPVIFLSFKDAHQNTYEEMYRSICFTLKDEFIRHMELLSSDAINAYDKKYYQAIVDGTARTTDYQFALGKLSSMLATHYGQKVIVIIDEYDTPIQQGHLNGYYNEIIAFMRNLLSSALKDNGNLGFGILTGILRIAKESLFSGLNNLVVNTVLDDRYSEYFGFTEAEVRDMASYYGMEEKLSEIREWYDGYLFGHTEIYNPWSVISYFNNGCKPRAFWSRTSGNEIIGQLITGAGQELYDSLSLLLQGSEVQSMIDTDIIYPEINGDPDNIYSFLLVAGYLRITEVVSQWNDTPICVLSLPNREIKSVFQREILDRYGAFFTGSILRNFELALRHADPALLTDTLHRYLLQSASAFDTVHENFYHGVVFGMLAVMSDRYYISSNRESGDGRFDIALEPKDTSQPGYIIEFKAGKNLSESELIQAAQAAIHQIQDRQYAADMACRGIQRAELFGVAFSGKRVSCEHRQVILGS